MPRIQKSEIPLALRNFDLLPDSASVRLPVVAGLFAISAATVWRRVQAGELPAPSKQSPRVTTWRVGDLRRALAKVPA
jgi:predicted DNA-binding transcriptional regulator AlpA